MSKSMLIYSYSTIINELLRDNGQLVISKILKNCRFPIGSEVGWRLEGFLKCLRL